MIGNVEEWCSDTYAAYPPGPSVDPKANPAPNAKRVARGGSFGEGPSDCRVAHRESWGPLARLPNIGFRVCLDSAEASKAPKDEARKPEDDEPATPKPSVGEPKPEREGLSPRSELKAVARGGSSRKGTPEDWATVDATIEGKVRMRNELMLRLDSLERQLGPNHPAVINVRHDLDARNANIAESIDLLEKQYIIRWRPDDTGGQPATRPTGPVELNK